jgi:hypothetical protein
MKKRHKSRRSRRAYKIKFRDNAGWWFALPSDMTVDELAAQGIHLTLHPMETPIPDGVFVHPHPKA